MQNLKWILGVAALLIANNAFLIWYLDNESEPVEETVTQMQDGRLKGGELRKEPVNQTLAVPEEVAVSQPQNSEPAELNDSFAGDEFSRSFRSFSDSAEFLDIMDNYTIRSGERMMRRMQETAQMSASELYDLFVSSDSAADRTLAMQGLSQGKMSQLEDYQIKELYKSGEPWGRMEALKLLLERDDLEAVEWAKEAATNPSSMMMGGHEVLPLLYEKDPEFVRDYVNNLSVDDASHGLIFLFQNDELKQLFFENNLDQILESSNSSVFQLAPHNIQVELDSNQQSRAIELLASSSSKQEIRPRVCALLCHQL